MQVELRDITKIKPYANNPRLNDDAIDAVAESIRAFGFRQPIVVDEKRHHRGRHALQGSSEAGPGAGPSARRPRPERGPGQSLPHCR